LLNMEIMSDNWSLFTHTLTVALQISYTSQVDSVNNYAFCFLFVEAHSDTQWWAETKSGHSWCTG
jgi:hypothetical protein